MKRYDLRHLQDDFYDRMVELINSDLKVAEVGIFLFEVGDFSSIQKSADVIKEQGHDLMNSLKFNEVDWTIVVKKIDEETKRARQEAIAAAQKAAEEKAAEEEAAAKEAAEKAAKEKEEAEKAAVEAAAKKEAEEKAIKEEEEAAAKAVAEQEAAEKAAAEKEVAEKEVAEKAAREKEEAAAKHIETGKVKEVTEMDAAAAEEITEMIEAEEAIEEGEPDKIKEVEDLDITENEALADMAEEEEAIEEAKAKKKAPVKKTPARKPAPKSKAKPIRSQRWKNALVDVAVDDVTAGISPAAMDVEYPVCGSRCNTLPSDVSQI